MAITIDGSGTITGISAGGLPDGSVTAADIASGVIPAALSNAEDGTGTNFEFNSGFGSNGVAYGVRAWINFDGSAGTIGTGRGSANMDAVTDNGTADYTVNFTNDMPDVNYAVLTGTHDYTTFGIHESTDPTVGAVRFTSRNPGNAAGLERDFYYVAIVR